MLLEEIIKISCDTAQNIIRKCNGGIENLGLIDMFVLSEHINKCVKCREKYKITKNQNKK